MHDRPKCKSLNIKLLKENKQILMSLGWVMICYVYDTESTNNERKNMINWIS